MRKSHVLYDLERWDFQAPTDDVLFEHLCRDLWDAMYPSHLVQLVGTSGQRQKGLDIYASHLDGDFGIQCKCQSKITPSQLAKIVADVLKHRHPIKKLLVTYNGKRDEPLQSRARLITAEHHSLGHFAVEVHSWHDILGYLKLHPMIAAIYLPEYRPPDLSFNVDTSKTECSNKLSSMDALITRYQLDLAQQELEDLKPRLFDIADNDLKFKYYCSLGRLRSKLGKVTEAGKLFIQAATYLDTPEALLKKASGLLMIDRSAEALEIALSVTDHDPNNGEAWSIVIRASAVLHKYFEVEKIPIGTRREDKVLYALAAASAHRQEYRQADELFEHLRKNEDSELSTNKDVIAEHAKVKMILLQNQPDFQPGDGCGDVLRQQLISITQLLKGPIDELLATGSLHHRVHWLELRSQAQFFLGNYREALNDLEIALVLEPDSSSLKKSKAVVLAQTGSADEALPLLDQVAESPQVPEARLIKAHILMEAGREDEARKELRTLMNADLPKKLALGVRTLLLRLEISKGNEPAIARLLKELSRHGATRAEVLA